MVRASLVKSDAFMRALGRPNRDQIVTMRPSELTTLEAIDLANGEILARAISHGANQWLPTSPQSSADTIRRLYATALSRSPTAEELSASAAMLGEKPTNEAAEDLLWSLFMLPEFQFVR